MLKETLTARQEEYPLSYPAEVSSIIEKAATYPPALCGLTIKRTDGNRSPSQVLDHCHLMINGTWAILASGLGIPDASFPISDASFRFRI